MTLYGASLQHTFSLRGLAASAALAGALFFAPAFAPAAEAQETQQEEAPLRIEVPREAPDEATRLRRAAVRDCYQWAEALLERNDQAESDRGLSSLLGHDYVRAREEDDTIGAWRFERRRERLMSECLARYDREAALADK